MIKVITSKDNKRVKYALSLRENKNQTQFKQFLGESLKSLELAIKANVVKEVFTYNHLNIDESIEQYLVNEDVMKKLSCSVNPEGVVFIADIKENRPEQLNKVLYLDHINDPGNMGTMIRTALAFNFDAVVVSKDSVSIYNDKVLASCKGANYLIPVFHDELSNYVRTHHIISSCLDAKAIDMNELEIPHKFVLVMGNEAHGISSEIRKLTNTFVKIPISNIDSLNVSVAAGILMHHLSK